MSKIILNIGGMTCSACSNGLEKYLKRQQGIKNVSVNLVLGQALIEYDDNIDIQKLNQYIKEAGFESLGVYNEKKENSQDIKKTNLIIFGFLTILIMYIAMSHMINLPVIPFLSLEKYPLNYALCLCFFSILFLFYGLDIFKSGYKNLIHKTPNMDTLVSIGVLASFLYSLFGTVMIFLGKNNYVHSLYFESVSTVIFFIKIGRFIDSRTKEKTKEAIKELVEITPTMAILKINDKEKEVTIDEVKIDDILICKPGMKVAVDGIIVSGSAHLDEAFITGESVPVKKNVNDNVIAGSINYDGYFEYKALKIGKNSTISEIVKLVSEATNTKAPISKIADKVSGIFVPAIMIIAFLTLIIYLILGTDFNIALTHFVSVLVVACPCALGLATPLAIVISEGRCAKGGILVKTSEILENAHKVDTIVFDKTGTLTYGNLKISKIYNYSNYNNEELMKIISSLESYSTHPISKVFNNYASENNLKLYNVKEFENIAGMGLSGFVNKNEYYVGNNKIISKLKIKNSYKTDEENLTKLGNSIVYVIENKKIIALLGLSDIVRSNAKEIIEKLYNLNKKIIMLTGDNYETANIVANELGIKEFVSELLPKDKLLKIEQLKNSNKVMMVGDGINDAPSLAASTIGVSLSGGTDVANNSADVILMNDNLESLVQLLIISERTIKNIKQNLFWAFFYNICMIPIAIGLLSKLGINMTPMVASLAMTLSSLTVVFNALRLKK